MTGNNINKLVRTNMHLKPWMLSKNTNQLVNKCIEKFYQYPDEEGKAPPPDGVKSKTPAPRVENKGPVRAFKLAERLRPPASINTRIRSSEKISNLHSDKLLSSVLYKSKHGAVAASASKKMLNKPVNCKIYGARRYGSSASSSTGSVFRNDQRANANTTHTSNYLLRKFGTIKTQDLSTSLRPIVANFLPKVRNQHMESNLGSLPNAIELSTVIQADLMDINSALKERIAVTRKTLNEGQQPFNSRVSEFESYSVPVPSNIVLPRENERYIASVELMNQRNKLKSTNHPRASVSKLRRVASRVSGISTKKTNRSRHKLKSKDNLTYRRDTRREQNLKRDSELISRQESRTTKLVKKGPLPKESLLNANRADEVSLKTERLLNQARRLNIDTEYLKLMMQEPPRRSIQTSSIIKPNTSYQIDLQLRKQAEQLAQLQTDARKIAEEMKEQNEKSAQAKSEKARTTKVSDDQKAKNSLKFEPYEYVPSQYGVKKAEERSRQNAMKTLQKETLNEIQTQIKETEKLIFEQSQKTGTNQAFKLFPTTLQQIPKPLPTPPPVTPKTTPRTAPKNEPTFMKPIERPIQQRPFKPKRQFSSTSQKKAHKALSPPQSGLHYMQHKAKKAEPEVKKSLWSFKGGKVEKPSLSKMGKPPAAALKAAKEAIRNKPQQGPKKEEPNNPQHTYVTSHASATAAASVANNNIKTSGPYASRINRRLYLNALRKF